MLFSKESAPGAEEEQGDFTTPIVAHRTLAASPNPPPTPPAHDSESREQLITPVNQRSATPCAPPPNNYYNNNNQYPYYPQPQYGYYPPPPPQPQPVVVIGKPDPLLTRRGWPPMFTYLTALLMLAVLVYELIRNDQLTGSAIQLSPFNIMIGPSASTLIQIGARFVPCMHPTTSYPVNGAYQCPNVTSSSGTTTPTLTTTQTTTTVTIQGDPCTLQEICGLTTFKDPNVPDQWYRFITAIFIHSGVIHYIFNMFVHLSLGASMERIMNPLRYAIVWLAAGTFGFIFGGIFAPVGNASVGCSGALFGVVALLFIDLFQNWRTVANPGWELTKLVFLILISFAFGLLPGLDNFAHIGGFVAGLLAGVVFLPAVYYSRPYVVGLWIVRVICLGGLAGLFYALITVFYSGRDPNEICSWCKYLACLPISNMCDAYYSS